MSRNKQLVGFNSRLCPAGSEKTISRWMTQQADSEVKYPEGLVRSVFDNEQVVGKTYRVKSDNKLPASVITSHLYIVIDEENLVQNEEKYSPSNWLFLKPTKVQEQSYLSMYNDSVTKTFRKSRNTLLSDRLLKVSDENGNDDVVNLFISEKARCENEKICVDCGGENEKNSRKCTNCGGLLIFQAINFTKFKKKVYPYNHFNYVEETSNLFKVKTGEPDLLNPSSFQNISEILYNLAERAGISKNDGQRKWLFLECDGGIYSIVEKLIFNVFVCSICHEAIYGEIPFREHRCSILHDVVPVHEFGWVLPMPGLLHLEMNACKAFFQLNWDIFMKDVCIELGFKTPKAQDCARKCSDHHKTFKILEILYIAMVDELLVPFVQFCKTHSVEATLDQYWIWSQDVKNANYMYCQQMALTFLHAIMVFRVGCRRANPSYIIAGREKMSLLFYCRNHPRYQRIVAINSYIEAMMPEDLKDLIMRSFTLSRTGNVGHYQGGDACLEEINKEAKSWISPVGVPTEKEWVKTFRNLDSLSEVKHKLLNSATGQSIENKTCSYEYSIDLQEIAPVRALFRRYFERPLEETPHTNLSGDVKLSAHLVNITAESEALRSQYYMCLLSGEQPKLPLVCVTEDEFLNSKMIENLSKTEIQKKIYQLLEQFSDRERRLLEEIFVKTVKAKNKADYIGFYYTLLEEKE
jgi:hypothetical protein